MLDLIMRVVPKAVLGTVARQILVAKKNSPHIFFAAGVVGTAASTVLACRSTLKLGDKLDEIQKEIEATKPLPPIETQIDAVEDAQVLEVRRRYSSEIAWVYTKAGIKVAKLYGPAIVVGAISIACLTGAHVQLARRNAALTAAYAALHKAYLEYRERVKKEVGDERELELYHGFQKKIVQGPDGKSVEVQTGTYLNLSPYARFFDEMSLEWQKNVEYNRTFLEINQAYFNHRLNSFGHVFLNEVYDRLGLTRTQAGSVVGWIRNSEDGDNYISFGLTDFASSGRDVMEPRILLDFNVDGIIYDKI